MASDIKTFQGTKFVSFETDDSSIDVFWGHGWGQDHTAFLNIIEPLKSLADHHVIDFPGFGDSNLPPDDWGTVEYADHIAALVRKETDKLIIWVGHSFGCRVGLQLAARHPELVQGMVLIAGAGLKRKRPLLQSLYFKLRIAAYKILKTLIPFGLPKAWLMKKFGSADYNSAGPMRQIFVKVVNEDLSDVAAKVTCPVHLVYGENDTETPPEIGQRLSKLIPNATLTVLQNQDHYSVLLQGRHQVTRILKTFIESLEQK